MLKRRLAPLLCLCLAVAVCRFLISVVHHTSSAYAPQAAALVINEYLADPPDEAAGDANGDGARSASADEFVELVNQAAAPLNVGGYTISDAAQVRFTFPPGTVIPAGEAAVIFGGGTPTGAFGNAARNGLVFTASLSLNNGGDTITIKDSGGATVEAITFGSSEGNANQSINRNPDVTGTGFAPHSTLADSGGRLFSPGARASGNPFTGGATGPRIASISPVSVVAGGPDLTLTITGERFQSGAVAFVAETPQSGPPLNTRFMTGEQLEATLPAAFTRAAGKVFIAVRNPDSGISNLATLNVLITDPLSINEFLADPANEGAGDANGDGERSASQDEFIEIVNRTAEPLDISGFKLADAEQARHVFPSGTILPPFEAAVVFGGGSPAGPFGNAAANRLVFKASSGGLSLNNGGDTIRLEDASGRVIQEVMFGEEQGNANQSINRDPDVDGAAFSLHTLVAADTSRLFSPGTRATGQLFSTLPRITALAPASVRAGSPGFTLTVTGANFLPGAVVLFNEAALATVYRSETELEAQVTAELIIEGGAAQVRVRNPKGETSAAVKFTVTDDPPRIVAITPQKTGTGAENLEVAVNGERFQRGAVGQVAGQEVETRFVNSAALVLVIPDRFFTSAGVLELRVLNADGNLSNAATLTVENGPLITRLSKRRFKAGRGDVEITVGGVAFQSGAVVFVNDTAVATSFVSETSLTARIPAEVTANPGRPTLQVRHPDGGRSNRVTIRVVP
ncbi:MAG TPA: lamin tail domain-containing protein [Blastocatellia bacterium]|nr:lamin tail domain-containing protein [Blastocatellia bacterium]